MVDSKGLLADLTKVLRALEADLRNQLQERDDVRERLVADYQAARQAARTQDTFETWVEEPLTQAAVAWILGTVFQRFLEDNELVEPRLSGSEQAHPGACKSTNTSSSSIRQAATAITWSSCSRGYWRSPRPPRSSTAGTIPCGACPFRRTRRGSLSSSGSASIPTAANWRTTSPTRPSTRDSWETFTRTSRSPCGSDMRSSRRPGSSRRSSWTARSRRRSRHSATAK